MFNPQVKSHRTGFLGKLMELHLLNVFSALQIVIDLELESSVRCRELVAHRKGSMFAEENVPTNRRWYA